MLEKCCLKSVLDSVANGKIKCKYRNSNFRLFWTRSQQKHTPRLAAAVRNTLDVFSSEVGKLEVVGSNQYTVHWDQFPTKHSRQNIPDKTEEHLVTPSWKLTGFGSQWLVCWHTTTTANLSTCWKTRAQRSHASLSLFLWRTRSKETKFQISIFPLYFPVSDTISLIWVRF